MNSIRKYLWLFNRKGEVVMNLIAAVDRNWGIGNNGELLYHIPQDMRFFRDTTMGKVVVMGRKTLESFPGGNPLKGRSNIVLTRDKNYRKEGVCVCHNMEELRSQLRKYHTEAVFVLGGEQVYKQLLPYCDSAYITKIDAASKADAHMVNLDNNPKWRVRQSSKDFTHDEITYRFVVYGKHE